MTQKKKLCCFFTAFLALNVFWILPAIAGDIYSITFSEGYYPQSNSTEGQFGALVVVRRTPCSGCVGVELGRFRGSTLSKAYWQYKDANGKPIWRDGQVQRLFAALRMGPHGYADVQSIAPILNRFSNERPIINGGEYSFTVKANTVFSPRGLQVNEGAYVRIEYPLQDMYLSNGIWIYKGIFTGLSMGLEGVLTIYPNDWERFIALFPNETEWVNQHATGILWIVRLLGEGQEPPNAISVQPIQPVPALK